MSSRFPEFKIIVVGDSNVGKTCIVERFLTGMYPGHQQCPATVHPEMSVNYLTALNTRVQLNIWDTAGQEKLRCLTHQFYRGCHAVVLIYDVGDRTSFSGLNWWVKELQVHAHPAVKYLVGNKIDMERVIQRREGEKFAREHGFDFFMETSAYGGIYVDNLFFNIAEKLMAKRVKGKVRDESVIVLKEEDEPQVSCWSWLTSCFSSSKKSSPPLLEPREMSPLEKVFTNTLARNHSENQ